MKQYLLVCVVIVSSAVTAWAQGRVITGTVTSAEDGSSLPGVSVVIKGTTTGTSTDANGSYSLSVPEGQNVLIYSFIGMQSQEVEIGNRTVIDIQLAEDVRQLSEVVVTALGIERSVKTLGYAASTIDADELTRSKPISALNALQGKMPGVQISTASGAPGASTKVIVRGYSSIGGNNSPLFVVDGVPVNNGANNFFGGGGINNATGFNNATRTQDFGNRANDINPDDIESLTVLKGVAATALYGSRAANGAIMITTKKGALNTFRVDYSGGVEFSDPLRLPQLQGIFGQGWSGHFAFDENGSWGPPMDGKYRLWGNVVDNSQKVKRFENRESNVRDFFKTGVLFNNDISISGGTNDATFYFSYGNAQQDGFVPTDVDSYTRNTFSLRGTLQGQKLRAAVSVNYVNKDMSAVTAGQGSSDGGATLYQELIQIPRDFSIVDFADYKDKFNNINNFYTPYADNPYWVINENGNKFNEDRVFGKFQLDYQVLEFLSATARFGGDIATNELKDWGAIATSDPGSINELRGRNDYVGRVDEYNRRTAEWNSDFILQFNKPVNLFSINALVGFNANQRWGSTNHAYVTNLDLPNYYNLANSSAPPKSTGTESMRRLFGVYGQAEVGFNEFLFLTFGARNDWSSTLPPDRNSFFYPSVYLSYVLSDHLELSSGLLDFIKLRASWGKNGNDADPYSIQSVYIPGEVLLPFGNIKFPISNVNGFEVSNQIGNPDLEPEISTEYEFGADIRLFGGRITLDAAYYNKTTDGQLLNVPLTPSTGYTSQVLNFGKVRNRGVEIGLGLTPVSLSNGFTWDIYTTFTKNDNKVLELAEGLNKVTITNGYEIDFVAKVGKPLGVFEGPVYSYTPDGKIIVDATGIPVIEDQKGEWGVAQNDFTLGINNSFSYRNLSLSAFIDIRQGGLFYSYTSQLTYFVGNATKTTYNMRQPFLVPNSVQEVGDGSYVENTTPIDMANVYTYWYSNTNPVQYRNSVLDRSFVKLREVVLTYRLPSSLISNLPVKTISLSAYGRNLLLWTPAENNFVDPETTTWGNDLMSEFGEFAAGPTMRSYGFSLKVGL